MQIALHGGFGEKGRTCLRVSARGYVVLLDAGVKTSARGKADYYPQISDEELRAADAIVITHAHEDHVAALGHFLMRGFAGRIWMTAETREDCVSLVEGYGGPDDAGRVRNAKIEPLPIGVDAAALGPLAVHTGRSGHIAGGVWCVLDDGSTRFGYCGDVAAASPVFAMDPMPPCDALAIDASYGDDDVAFAQRAAQVVAWIEAHPQGAVLPTPQYGRSLELFVLLGGRAVLAPGMREALTEQLRDNAWLRDTPQRWLRHLHDARDWAPGQPLPAAPVLCHDGMGMHGPSRELLHEAGRLGHPVLLTGHVPEGSPGERLLHNRQADWIRLPTHPTLHENIALAHATRASVVLGHSCESAALARLAAHLPALRVDAATGDCLEIG